MEGGARRCCASARAAPPAARAALATTGAIGALATGVGRWAPPLRSLAMAAKGAFYRELEAEDGALRCFIDGRWMVSSSGKTVGVSNPTTQEECCRVQGEHVRTTPHVKWDAAHCLCSLRVSCENGVT